MTRDRLVGLDALRGIAAMVVATVCHAGNLIGPWHHRAVYDMPGVGDLIRHSDVAVDLFFVLSGFVFAHVYEHGVTAWPFFRARIARIYPLHFATLVATAILLTQATPAFTHNVPPDARHFILNLLMLQRSGLEDGYSFNSPSWSLSIEILCYLAFVVLLRTGRYRMWAAATVLLGIALCFDPYLSFFGRGLGGFFVGSLLCTLPSLPLSARWALCALTPIAFLLPQYQVGISLSLTLFPVLIDWARNWTPPPALIWLGDRSFSLYLIHLPVYWALSIYLLDGGFVTHPGSMAVVMTVGVGMALILSDFSFRNFETPARRWINNWSPPQMIGRARA